MATAVWGDPQEAVEARRPPLTPQSRSLAWPGPSGPGWRAKQPKEGGVLKHSEELQVA